MQKPKVLFLDTNIWLRYFLGNSPQSTHCKQLFVAIFQNHFHALTSTVVILEVYYVLHKEYGLKKTEVQQLISPLFDLNGLKVIDKTQTIEAWKLHLSTGVKFADCCIAVQVPQNAVLVSFDKEFAKIPIVRTATPAQLVLN